MSKKEFIIILLIGLFLTVGGLYIYLRSYYLSSEEAIELLQNNEIRDTIAAHDVLLVHVVDGSYKHMKYSEVEKCGQRCKVMVTSLVSARE